MDYPKKNPNIIFREIDGQSVLLNDEKGEIHQLNETASFIWKNCSGNNSLQSLVDLLKENFQTDSENIEKDVKNIIEMLGKLHLIEVV